MLLALYIDLINSDKVQYDMVSPGTGIFCVSRAIEISDTRYPAVHNKDDSTPTQWPQSGPVLRQVSSSGGRFYDGSVVRIISVNIYDVYVSVALCRSVLAGLGALGPWGLGVTQDSKASTCLHLLLLHRISILHHRP